MHTAVFRAKYVDDEDWSGKTGAEREGGWGRDRWGDMESKKGHKADCSGRCQQGTSSVLHFHL